MTSDAKIGLLLGLVFIFIIAFVINGLPRFRSTTNGSELTTNMVSSHNNTLGIGDNEREIQDLIDWPQTEMEEPPPVTETAESPLEDEGEIRYQRPLPDIVPFSPVVETADESESIRTRPDEQDSAEKAPAEPADSTIVKLFDPPAPEPPHKKKTEVEKPSRPVRRRSPKVYVVSDGDNLAKIAKKIYGPEEGNKHANIMRIFELNRGLLSSPDEVQIGQKLIIPSLLRSSADRKKVTAKNTDSFFEKVESIGRKVFQGNKQKPAPARSTRPKVSPDRQYVVKEGDSLWQIAASQLGDGSRYKEIVKLNADILEDENSLPLGTTLKMPAR